MSFDATFVAFIALALFIGLLIYLKVPGMIAKALDERAAAIGKDLAEARRLREEAQALYREYEAKRAAAEGEAKVIIEAAKEQAAALTAEARADHAQSLERRRKQAEERIARAGQQAEAEIRAAAADAAISAAEKKLRESMNADAQAALITQGVEELQKKFG